MGTFDFARDAGSSIMSASEEDAAHRTAENDAAVAALNVHLAEKLLAQATALGLATGDVRISFDVTDGRAKLCGVMPSQAEREKLVLFLGNKQGVALVDDEVRVQTGAAPSLFYTVVKGDTLSTLAKAHYGDPLKYGLIFEANRPLLKNPDLIYPGQVLRLPKPTG